MVLRAEPMAAAACSEGEAADLVEDVVAEVIAVVLEVAAYVEALRVATPEMVAEEE